MTDWESIARAFAGNEQGAYLDAATCGLPPRAVTQAVRAALDAWEAGTGDWRAWEAAGERARDLFARRVQASPASIALVPAVSVAAGQVAADLSVRPGDNWVVGEAEFRSNLFPWLAQAERGVEVRTVPFRSGRPTLEDFLARIDASTRLVAFSSVQSASGARAPLEELSRAARDVGARVFVDGTQSVGALDFDVRHCDYLAVGAYKWLLAPRGTGFLYVAEEHWAESRPIAPGWKSAPDPHAEYYGPPYELAPDAKRLDVSLAWFAWVGAAAALEFHAPLPPSVVERRVLELAERFRHGLHELGLRPMVDPEHDEAARGALSPIASVPFERAERARASLAERGVRAAVRAGSLRFAFHLFNREDHVDLALEALAETLARS